MHERFVVSFAAAERALLVPPPPPDLSCLPETQYVQEFRRIGDLSTGATGLNAFAWFSYQHYCAWSLYQQWAEEMERRENGQGGC